MEPSLTAHDPIADMSPALTNPDMILPYQSRSSSPSPSPYHIPSSFLQTYRQKLVSSLNDKASMRMIHGTGNNLLMGQGESSIGPLRPPLPGAWQTDEDFHAAYDPPQSRNPPQSRSPPLSSSPTLHADDLTNSLNSTHIEQGYGGRWIGPDSGAINDGISPYSDVDLDLESPFGEGGSDKIGVDDGRNGIRAILEEDEDDPSSHAALSLRAEKILANAKKRLIEMEDNLSRARQTLKEGASSKPKIRDSVSRQSPPMFKGSENKESWRIPSSKQRQAKLPQSPGKAAGHSRVFSETAISDFSGRKPNYDPQRASSAMGRVDIIPNFRDNLGYRSGEANGTLNPTNRNGKILAQQYEHLGPLHEDETTQVKSYDSSHREGFGTEKIGHRYGNSNTSYFNTGRTKPREFARSRSTMQLRDLREQMEDLKGKVTSLKVRTQEDRLQRRSLQTLKAPSPFTIAQDWKEGSNGNEQNELTEEVRDSRGDSHQSDQSTKATKKDEMPGDSRKSPQTHGDHGTDEDSNPQNNHTQIDEDDASNSAGLTETTTFEDSTNGDADLPINTSNKVLFSEETPPATRERHEDRPDAFDYEHFFLHSGMGTLRRPDQPRSRSQSSSDSAETTRPGVEETSISTLEIPSPNSSAEDPPNASKATLHIRQPSKDSISTVATFATATENNDYSTGLIDTSKQQSPLVSTDWQSPSISRDPTTQLQMNDNPAGKEKDQRVQNGTYLYPFPSHERNHSLASTLSSSSKSVPTSPLPPTLLPPEIKLSAADQALVQHLLQSLHTACRELHDEAEGDGRGVKAWRRRIDAARRTLDGEINMI